jgi:non-specific serine/threonine protein kinase
MLASSREALHVPGEQLYPVRPLPLPGRDVGLEELVSSTAVRLFVERARQHKPNFAPDQAQAPILAELVSRLDGIPLAIELAAARIKVLSLADINVRLKDRFKLLTGGARVLQERQQTLRALVDWSYDLLSPQEQTLLARLTVFVGGFELEAAEQICGADPLSAEEVLDLLGSLVEKSLVMFDESEESTRYRMLETIRDYAREKLEQSGDRPARAAAHCDHYFALAKQANYGMRGPEQAEWIRRVEADLDNVRAAIALALAGETDPFIAVKIAVAMNSFWMLRGYATEGRRIVRAALDLPAVAGSDIAQAWALYVGAALAESQSDHREALEMLERCLVLRRGLGNRGELAGTLSTISLARLQAGDVNGARESEREALEIFSEVGDRRGEAIGHLHLGQIAVRASDNAAARSHFERCLVIAREIGQQECEGAGELSLGIIACDDGEVGKAASHFERSLMVCRDAADKRGEATAIRWLGHMALTTGNLQLAQERLIDAAKAFKAFEMWEELLDCLEDLAALSTRNGALTRAIRLSAVTTEARAQLRLVRSPRHEKKWAAKIAELRQAVEPATYEAEWVIGAAWAVEDALSAFQDDTYRSSAPDEVPTAGAMVELFRQ